MFHDVIKAKHVENYKIELEFDDRKRGIVDFSDYLEKGGVFKRFQDIEFFKNFKINEELGVLTWGDEIDIAPETLYSKATGAPLPDWMDLQDVPSTNISFQPTS